jgi:hypothetical protein
MPSKSAKQERFMQAAAHNQAFAKRAGISQAVAREFVAADKRRKNPGTHTLSKKTTQR